MNITFYSFDKRINSTKNGSLAASGTRIPALSLTGDFEAESSLFMPTVIVANDSISTLQQYNYFSIAFPSGQIPATRYYFIRDITVLPSGRCRVVGVEDVLGTFNIKTSRLHITAANRLRAVKLTNHSVPVNIPVDYRRIVEHKVSLDNLMRMDPVNGIYIIAIGMPECTVSGAVPYVLDKTRKHATLNRSGIGYYTFSKEGALYFLNKVQQKQQENSDFNLNEKIISIMYLPIPFTYVEFPGITNDLGFYIGDDANGNPDYILMGLYDNNILQYNVYPTVNGPYINFGISSLTSIIPETDVKYNQGGAAIGVVSPVADQLNYEPYTSLELTIPYFGTMPINISDLFEPLFPLAQVQNGSYTAHNDIDARADIITGIATLRVMKHHVFMPDGGGAAITQDSVVIEKTTQLGCNIPFYGYESASAISKQILEVENKRTLNKGIVATIAGGIGLVAATVATAGIAGAVAAGTAVTAGSVATAVGGFAAGSLAVASGAQDVASSQDLYRLEQEQMNVEHGYTIGSNSGTVLAATYESYYTVRCAALRGDMYYTPGNTDLSFALSVDIFDTINNLLTNSAYGTDFYGMFIKCDTAYYNAIVPYLTYDEQTLIANMLNSGVYIE